MRLAGAALALTVMGCGEQTVPPPTAGAAIPPAKALPLDGPATWSCSDGQSVTVTLYGEPERVEILLGDGRRLTLLHTVSASGALYEATAHSFHTKGDEALLTSGAAVATCRREGGTSP